MSYSEKEILAWGEEKNTSQLELILIKGNSNERLLAINELVNIGDTKSLPALEKLIKKESAKNMIRAAFHAVDAIGATPKLSELIDKYNDKYDIMYEKEITAKEFKAKIDSIKVETKSNIPEETHSIKVETKSNIPEETHSIKVETKSNIPEETQAQAPKQKPPPPIPKMSIIDRSYGRKMTHPISMLLLSVIVAFNSRNAEGVLIIISIFLILVMLVQALYLFVTPIVSISIKQNLIRIRRNLIINKSFKVSDIGGVYYNGSSVVITDKNYKKLGKFSLKEINSNNVIKFKQDIESIVHNNNPRVETKETKSEVKKKAYKRAFILNKYKRNPILAIIIFLIIPITIASFYTIKNNALGTEDNYVTEYEDNYYEEDTELERMFFNIGYILIYFLAFVLFISIWMFRVPLILIQDRIIVVKPFLFKKKVIIYTKIERIDEALDKISLYGKNNMLLAEVNIRTLNADYKEDFKSTLNQIVEENKMANQDK